jgi:hypothetical protein
MFCLDKIKVNMIADTKVDEKQLIEAVVSKFRRIGGNSDQINDITIQSVNKDMVVCHVYLHDDGPLIMTCVPCSYDDNGYNILVSKVIVSI